MDGFPRARKRFYSSIDEIEQGEQAAATDLPSSAPTSKSSPLPQRHDSPSLSMKMPIPTPMPLHHPTAGLLRTQSPLVGQHLLSMPIHFHRASTTPLVWTTLDAPPPHSYGSCVSLDPASLSPIPDPVAVAEIKRLIPEVLKRATYKDVAEMVEALMVDGPGTTPPSHEVKPPALESDQINGGISGGYTVEMAGAEFDAFLSQMTEEDLKDPHIIGEHVDPESSR
ncbi:uncharacterized protein Z519_09937 [Cladophialophora bantiana CBS 173.52]|uniref:Uncharacterized protein n=1 Tax=Cladophialophora bantiana (strain ATCC 10958 / CBS 173.52 / CDC B-1940 / NIH 8579) TaxID=1442370 RepID=A0A0D2HG50_CLAB1|nr:uncharacterized protein Z519_09937 [Cladophialophora bantiana CBS 173.52]KIW89780.1 hypothetical protein Z519_09937 [Cladophialophora bantiana CBS 173.52]